MERRKTIAAYWLQRQIAAGLVVLLTSTLLAQTTQPAASQPEGTSPAGQTQTTPQPQDQPAAPTSQPAQAPQPVGTAVAPYEKTVGAASSRPAGAVIAPAKQRRAHSVLIKVALIAAGAAAIGTVVALSKASPSRPN